MPDLVQMIGRTFARLTVVEMAPLYIDGSGRKRLKYVCSCACGGKFEVLGENLRSGHTTSCGCIQDENRRKRAKDAAGLRFGRLRVTGEAEKYVSPQGKHLRQVYALCDCGVEIITNLQSLKKGLTASCGCYRTELAVGAVKHGDARKASPTREYKAWSNMIARCENPNVERYQYYGGRGIKVCDEWRNEFEAFLRDMGRKPSLEHSIDRIDVNGNYEPGNCRWATAEVQANNKRRSRAA
jgi:hypothetical protein